MSGSAQMPARSEVPPTGGMLVNDNNGIAHDQILIAQYPFMT
jgi:hypothetical protein